MFVLPSFFILYALVWVYLAYGSPPVVAGVLYGIKPAVVAIVLFACYRIGSSTFKNKLLWANALFAFISILSCTCRSPLSRLLRDLLYILARHLSGAFQGGRRTWCCAKGFRRGVD